MSTELLEFENTVEAEDGRSYIAVVLGDEREDGRWAGRIRFTPTDGSPPLETEGETTQPKREFVEHWAGGLTYSYLEGALKRALHRGAREAEEPTPALAGAEPGTAPSTPALRPVPRLEVASLAPGVAEQVMGVREPRPGTVREVPEAGVIVYEGTGGADGVSHLFAVQYGSRNAGATLANWLWSRLHGVGADVRVDGRTVELTNDALARALLD